MQAFSRRFAVATTFLRYAASPLKYLFWSLLPRRRKRYFTCGNFFIKITARSKRCGSFPQKCPANLPGAPLIRFAPTYFCQKISHTLRHSSSFAKRRARLTCSVASVLTTVRCRYHLFAIIVRFTCLKPLFLLHLRRISVRTLAPKRNETVLLCGFSDCQKTYSFAITGSCQRGPPLTKLCGFSGRVPLKPLTLGA